MPRMIRWADKLRVVLILLALLLAAVAPFVASGYADLRRAEDAQAAKDYVAAAQYYKLAANKLPWRPELLERAAIAMVHVDADSAIALFEQVRARGALSANGWDMYGAAYWTTSRDKPALDIWMAGLQQYPSYAEFYYLIHLAYRQLGDYPSEKLWLEKWLATGKGRSLDHYEMGLLLMATNPARARTEFALSSSMEPDSVSAVQTLETSLDLAARQSDDSSRLVVIGRGLGLVNQWPLAESVFEQAVNANQQNPEAWAWLGEARQEDLGDGKPELDKALSLDPNNTMVRALRGLYWKRQGKYSAQLAEYLRAAQVEPENPEWQAALGEAYTSTGDLVSALSAYQKATSLAPEKATYWRLLALFSVDNGVQILDVGLPAAKKAGELAPNDPQVLDALGWSFAQAGLLYNAEQTLIKATDLAPGNSLAHLHLAETYLRAGDQTSALRELKVARELDGEGAVGTLAAQLIQQYFP